MSNDPGHYYFMLDGALHRTDHRGEPGGPPVRCSCGASNQDPRATQWRSTPPQLALCFPATKFLKAQKKEPTMRSYMPPHKDPHICYIDMDAADARRGGTTRIAKCICGWVGPERGTFDLAADDAKQHELRPEPLAKLVIDARDLKQALYESVCEIIGGVYQITEVDGNMGRHADAFAQRIYERAGIVPIDGLDEAIKEIEFFSGEYPVAKALTILTALKLKGSAR